MRINAGHLQKLTVLCATAAPGGYKVLLFILVQRVYGLDAVGAIASWQSIAQIVGFFTAIGWSSVLMVRVAKAGTITESVKTLNSLMAMACITLLVCALAILFGGLALGKQSDASQIAYWLSAWTFYQVPRHYLMGLKKYGDVLKQDAVLLLLTLAAIAVVPAEHASAALALAMFVTGTATLAFQQTGSGETVPEVSYDLTGLEFGMVNFLSGAIALSIVPFAVFFEGEKVAGIIAMFLSIAGVALLLPRAISINQLPGLASAIDEKEKLEAKLKFMRRHIGRSNIITSIFGLAVAWTFALRHADVMSVNLVWATPVLIVVQNFILMRALVDANLLMANERSRVLMNINLIASVFFLSALLPLLLVDIGNAFFYVCVSIVAAAIFRTHMTSRYARREL